MSEPSGRTQPSWRLALFYVCLAATGVIVPMLFLGNASGHDFRFHVESWMDVAGQWREGILFPRWAEWANWGFGEPRLVFYPPLSWLLGAAVGSVLPWNMAPGAFIWITLAGAGMAMWRLAREWISEPHAILAGALYAINPYNLVIVYYRSAFGELVAAAILPLLIWAALRANEGGWRRVPWLAFTFAACWLANAPGAVIATYSLGCVLLAGCVLRRSVRPLLAGTAGMAGGFGLAAFYILPAASEQRWVQIAQSVTAPYHPTANFLFSRANDPDFVAFNWKVSWVAVGLIVVTAIGVVLVFARANPSDKKDSCWILLALGVVSTLLMLPPSAFLWRVLPELRFLQFPWRWLDVLALASAFFCAAAIGSFRSRMISRSVAALLFVSIAAAGIAMGWTAFWDSSDVADIAHSIQAGRGYEGTDEYTPVGCDRYQLPGNPDDSERPAEVSPNPAPRIAKLDSDADALVPAAGVRLRMQTWSAENRTFTADAPAPVTLAPRVLGYPAWHTDINGEAARPDLRSDTDQILVRLPAGNNSVQLRFGETPDRVAGDSISGATFIALLCFGFWAKRRAP